MTDSHCAVLEFSQRLHIKYAADQSDILMHIKNTVVANHYTAALLTAVL
jgi:hypothetical protein